MSDWMLWTRCCVGRDRAVRDIGAECARPGRTRTVVAVRAPMQTAHAGATDWRGYLRDAVSGRWSL